MSDRISPSRAGSTSVAVRVWMRPVGVGHIRLWSPYASCAVLRIWRIDFTDWRAGRIWSEKRDGNARDFTFSARWQSPTKRRAWYFRPAIVSAFGTTVFEIRPIAQSRESGRSSGGTPQLVLSLIFSFSTGTL